MIKLRILDMTTKQVHVYEGKHLDNLGEEEADEIMLRLNRTSGEGGPYKLERYHDPA